ncbi:protein odr-4 homolog isoform X3 [Oreochromis aureus]|uniref:protein odr-4 homolog isoform X3 n=1 Tax=Oreochromis aureus TaxID=47969 RepID=UPI001953DF14|nr:protein odr-4 homolog isoform X3 [Oreochromis aureus]
MGRGYIVQDDVEGYLSKLCEQKADPVTGLLIGQSSTQRDFVVMAIRTPQKEESAAAARNSVDKEWVTEHARQVSRMLPGGLSVVGVFIITDADAKDALTTLRQLLFAVENLISSEHLWDPADDDVTDCVTLQINPKTRKTVCRTFDIKDPKSVAKPADWKYQSGLCSSWATVSCSLNVDMLLPLPNNRTSTGNMEECLKEGLKAWAHQIECGLCLIDGKRLPEDSELTVIQQENSDFQCFSLEEESETDIHSSAAHHNGKQEVNRCDPAVWRQRVSNRSNPQQSLSTQQQAKGQTGREAAEEGRGFYGGHESSNDAGGAAGIRPGEQGQLQRQTTERAVLPPPSYLLSTKSERATLCV